MVIDPKEVTAVGTLVGEIVVMSDGRIHRFPNVDEGLGLLEQVASTNVRLRKEINEILLRFGCLPVFG